jgi:hypothetical protein
VLGSTDEEFEGFVKWVSEEENSAGDMEDKNL